MTPLIDCLQADVLPALRVTRNFSDATSPFPRGREPRSQTSSPAAHDQVFSAAMYAVILTAIAVNSSALQADIEIWPRMKSVHGVVQRLQFAAWLLWCMGYAELLERALRTNHRREAHEAPLDNHRGS